MFCAMKRLYSIIVHLFSYSKLQVQKVQISICSRRTLWKKEAVKEEQQERSLVYLLLQRVEALEVQEEDGHIMFRLEHKI